MSESSIVNGLVTEEFFKLFSLIIIAVLCTYVH